MHNACDISEDVFLTLCRPSNVFDHRTLHCLKPNKCILLGIFSVANMFIQRGLVFISIGVYDVLRVSIMVLGSVDII